MIKTNALNYVFEDILTQYDEDKVLYFVVYLLKKHNSIECNYKIYNKELMTIVRTFEEWRLKLKGSTNFIKIITNHKNLKYFMLIKQLSRR